jgi:hypothetical protein
MNQDKDRFQGEYAGGKPGRFRMSTLRPRHKARVNDISDLAIILHATPVRRYDISKEVDRKAEGHEEIHGVREGGGRFQR